MEEDKNSLEEGGQRGWSSAQRAQHPVWPPCATTDVRFWVWQRKNCSRVAVAGDRPLWMQKAARPKAPWALPVLFQNSTALEAKRLKIETLS